MPDRVVRRKHSLLIALAGLLLLVTAANLLAIANATSIRDNCRRIAKHSANTRAVLEQSLTPLKNGESDDDYRMFFGTDLVDYNGEKLPHWVAAKQRQIDRLTAQIASFAPVDCTVTIVRWIKGD